MDERRATRRDKVLYGGVAAISRRGLTRDCVVKNISAHGATLEFGSAVGLPDQIAVMVPRQARTYQSKLVWQRGNTVGVAFADRDDSSELGEQLRRSERKARQLRHRIKLLLGEA